MSLLNGPAFDTASVSPPVYHHTLNNQILANPALGLFFLLGAVKAVCEDQFECANSACILPSQKCDGHDDCGDLSDENDCGPELYKGARVVRGRDWEWGDQDGNGPGTVTLVRADKWVEVTWDAGQSNVYRLGVDNKYDLHPVVHYGSRVVRGKAWKWGDQDGNPPGQGVVTEVASDWATVEWDAGFTNRYRLDSANIFYDLMILDNKPYVGARVLRGIDWSWGNQDGNGPGNITKVRTDGWVQVDWDNGNTNVYRLGGEGKYDLKIVGQQVVMDTRVVRGKDWSGGDQDGNPPGPGFVTHVYYDDMDGWVQVLWDAGQDYPYRMGRDLKYDIRPVGGCICDKTSVWNFWVQYNSFSIRCVHNKTEFTEAENACVGARVARGRDWIWEDQDGVPPGHGTITWIDSNGWVAVQWDAADWNVHRVGVDGKYDLRLLSECRKAQS